MRLLANVFQLAFLLAVAGGAAIAWTYYRSDELLRSEILTHLTKVFPEATVTLERANYDLQGRVRLFDLSLTIPGESQPAATIAEVAISVDQELFAAEQKILIREIHLNQPAVRVVRQPDSQWNWQRLRIVQQTERTLPDIHVHHGHVELILADHETRTMVNVPLNDLQILAIPTSQKSFSVELSAMFESLGRVQLEGELPIEPAPWNMRLNAGQLKLTPETVRLLLIAAPHLRPKFEELSQKLESACRHVPAYLEAARSVPQNPYNLGLTLSGALQLQLAQTDPTAPLSGQVQLQIKQGQLTHPALPYPLFDLKGTLHANAQEIHLQNLAARTGESRFEVQAGISSAGDWRCLVQSQHLLINDALISRLPEALQRHIRALDLSGVVTGQIQVQRKAGGRPIIDAEATLSEGSVCHEKFPYRVRQIDASLTWHHDAVQIQARGLAGISPVEVLGTIHRPGPEGDATFDIRARDLSADDALRQALPESIARIFDALQFQGRGDAWVRLLRPPGLGQKYECQLVANVRDGSLTYRDFPYPLQQASGRLRWHHDVVSFDQLRAQHDGTLITGSGHYQISPDPGQLRLDLKVENAAFDRALYAALPSNLQSTWDSIAPQGQFDVTAEVAWFPGYPVQVNVPLLQVRNSDFQLRDFPYPFKNVDGRFTYRAANRKVEILELTARHDDTRLAGSGSIMHHDDGSFDMTLEKFHVDDLAPTPAFRRTLPAPLQAAVEYLNPTGIYSFNGPVTLRGSQQHTGLSSAMWDFEVLLADCGFNAGLRVENVHGRVHLAGQWTPRTTAIDAQLDLDALDVLTNHQLTRIRGPLSLRDGVLVAGSAQMAKSTRGAAVARVPLTERISADAFDGQVTLDAVVDLTEEPVYTAAVELTGGSLEKYAMRHLRGYSSVRGLMNGWMDLRGRGTSMRGLTGEGQLQISPAALYELPVFLQIFQLPQFAPVNRAAFDFANFFFKIDNERFNFDSIDLVGNTISLRGRGVIRFDGAVMLDFYSSQPRNQIRVPGLRELVGVVNLVSQGWIAIEVRGPIGAPVARVVPLPAVDDALQQFLSAFNPRAISPPPIPWRGAPRTTFAPESAPQ